MITLIRNARVLGFSELVDVIIENERISSIGKHGHVKACLDINAREKLLMPGFVNIHTHLDKSGLSDIITNDSGTIIEAREKLRKVKKDLTKEDIKKRAKETLINSIQNGVTALRTHVDIDPEIGLKGFEALQELKDEMGNLIDLQVVAFPQEGINEAPGTLKLLREAISRGADIVGGHLSIACDYQEHCKQVFDLAVEFNKAVDIHVDYDIDRDYSKIAVHEDGHEYPDELGVVWICKEVERRNFKKQVSASHLCGLDAVPPEIAAKVINLLARTNISVIALPLNNLYMHGRMDKFNVRRGVTKVKSLLDAGVNVSFGSDNIRDPFNPLGSASMIFNAAAAALTCHMTSREDLEKTVKMHTTDAAKIMNLQNYGLNPGCYADIIILDADNIEKALAYQANVTHVFKRGSLIATTEISKTFLCD